MLQSMEWQRVGHNWATELNCTGSVQFCFVYPWTTYYKFRWFLLRSSFNFPTSFIHSWLTIFTICLSLSMRFFLLQLKKKFYWSIVDLQYYIIFRYITKWFNSFIDYTPFKVMIKNDYVPCVVQCIFVAYLFYIQ